MTEHLAGRPSWDCLSCEKPWPCDPAREALAADSTDVVSLSILMWTYFEDYALESGPGPLTEAMQRFLGWIRIDRAQGVMP